MKTIAQIINFFSKQGLLSQVHFNQQNAYVLIENLCQDHKGCQKGDIFIALKGQRHDGHQYVSAALEKGANLIVVEDIHLVPDSVNKDDLLEVREIKHHLSEFAGWFYDFPSQHLQIYAVTGTNGKSTIAHFIGQLLTKLGYKSGVLGTIGNGIYPKLYASSLTTLDTVNLNKVLKDFVRTKVKSVAMEVSSHAIDQNRIKGINIEIAIFSNLDVDHLDYHQSMVDYFEVKARLFRMQNVQKCIINIDNEYGVKLYQDLLSLKTKQVLTFSIQNKKADCFIAIERYLQTGFEVSIYWKEVKITQMLLPIMGEYNLSNIAAAITALLANGYSLESVKHALPFIQNAKGRLEQLKFRNKALVVIDYAHTPDALQKALQALQSQLKGRLYCVFGCGGERETSKRPLMAKVAQIHADFCIITEDNSRTEPIDNIMADILRGFDKQFSKYIVIKDRKKAIEYVLTHTTADDIILLAGKGHETYLDKNNFKIHFDEREVVMNLWSKDD